jgi:hypothetical protein
MLHTLLTPLGLLFLLCTSDQQQKHILCRGPSTEQPYFRFLISPNPKAHVRYFHHLASVVVRKSSFLKPLGQLEPNLNLDEQFYIPLKYANFRNLVPI